MDYARLCEQFELDPTMIFDAVAHAEWALRDCTGFLADVGGEFADAQGLRHLGGVLYAPGIR